jgi:hypothetical protein
VDGGEQALLELLAFGEGRALENVEKAPPGAIKSPNAASVAISSDYRYLNGLAAVRLSNGIKSRICFPY